ncbi:hypothetical protein X556_1090 [Chlamydia pneumoniae B21]|nr:hypothetical protein X556_1090 [Chlamydia pneumoniae B21]
MTFLVKAKHLSENLYNSGRGVSRIQLSQSRLLMSMRVY